MNDSGGQWAWIADERPVQTGLDVTPFDAQVAAHPATDPAVVIALRLRMQGLPEEALQTLCTMQGDTDALLLRGQILFELERFEEAAESYAELAETYADHPFASFNHGICLARLARWDIAAESLQRAVNLDPDEWKAWFALGVCLLNQGVNTEAKACFSRSLKLAPDYAPALFGRAAALHVEGNHDEALAIYERMLDMQPEREELLANALAAAVELQDAPKIAGLAARLMRVHPESPAATLALFYVAAAEENIEDAAKWCEQLAKNNVQSFEHLYNLGICYQRLRRYGDAVAALDQALQLRPDDADAMEGLAQCLSELSEPTREKEVWRRLLQFAPEREDCWFRLGVLHQDCGEPAEAALAFDNCVRLKPNWLEAWLNLGGLHWSRGTTDEATEAFKTVLALDPENTLARKALAAFAIEGGDLVLAASYRKGLRSDTWDLAYNLALLEQEHGGLDEAAKLYREVLEVKPDFPEAWLNLGNVLFALGDVPQSQECWKSALAKKPELSSQFLWSACRSPHRPHLSQT